MVTIEVTSVSFLIAYRKEYAGSSVTGKIVLARKFVGEVGSGHTKPETEMTNDEVVTIFESAIEKAIEEGKNRKITMEFPDFDLSSYSPEERDEIMETLNFMASHFLSVTQKAIERYERTGKIKDLLYIEE